VAVGIVQVAAAAHTLAARSVLEAPPFVEVLVAAFVAELADIVGHLSQRVPGRTWRQHLEVGSIHFEGHHSLGRPEPGAAFRPSLGQHSHFGCRLRELQLP
jgi:hypothetical protein